MSIIHRPRRNRKSAAIRNLLSENELRSTDFIKPYFVLEDMNMSDPIASLPGQSRLGLKPLLNAIEKDIKLGIESFVFFPVVDPAKKSQDAAYSYSDQNFYNRILKQVKTEFPDIALMTDVALDPYNSLGHDGLVIDGKIDNDASLEVLGKMALRQAESGADIIGPSDMMDGRVLYLRNVLDEAGFTDVSIMSYTAKYASAWYGPFRDALDSAPSDNDGVPKDKKTYQMNPANAREAMLEAELDYSEGADMLMVKPASLYLDIIYRIKTSIPLPLTAYNVSGEYASIMAASEKGWLDKNLCMEEMLLSIKRAGADAILTYFATDMAQLLHERLP